MEFDRDSNASPIALYRHYCLLVNVIAQRGYVMLTKATRDAFDAKLQELLAYADAEMHAGHTLDKYAQQQIHYLAEINALFEGAYNITDEGHEASRIKDEMRYTFGKKIYIPLAQIRDLQLFFDGFFKIKYDSAHSFFDLIQRNSGLAPPDPEQLKKVMVFLLVKELLPECFPKKTEAVYEKIKAFLFEGDDSDPTRIEEFLTPEEYSRVLLYRELCQSFVNYALDRRLFVNYGPAEEKDPRAQLGLTVYFKYNNVRSPNQFSHYLETAVLTIFMVYGLGIDRFTFDRLMRRFYERNRGERIQLALSGKFGERTETEKLFRNLFGFELETVNFKDPTAMATAFDKVKLNPEIITIALRDEILPNVDTYDEELFKDSITHAYRYRDRVLLSGTLRSYKTFDHKVEHRPARTLAVNGLIRKTINDNAQVVVLRKMPAQEYIHSLMEIEKPGELTAIIDVGAHLEGVSNQEVARYIGEKLILQGLTDKIHYVLFCKDGEWCALSTHDLDKAPIRLNGTTEEELGEKLGPVGCRFTFYDQARCEGADIRQPLPKDIPFTQKDAEITAVALPASLSQAKSEENKQKIAPASRAIVTVEKDTTESAYQQGCYRMRGLGNGQVLTVVVHEELARKMQATKPTLQPRDVADFTFETELKGLIPDHKHAARFRMFNALREDLAKRIKQVPDKGKWPLYFGHFREFFIRSQSLSAIELFASKWKKMPLKKLLEKEVKNLMKKWQRVIKAAGISLSDTEVKAMHAQLQEFMDQALKDCEHEALYTSKRAVGTETQVQMEQQKQKEVKKELEIQPHNPNYSPAYISLNWIEPFLQTRDWQKESSSQCRTYVNAYQSKLNEEFKGNKLNLSTEIYATDSYYRTCTMKQCYKEIFSLYGRYTKPIQNLLFVGTDSLAVIILTPEEADKIQGNPNFYQADLKGKMPYLWLEEISGIPIAGKRPDDITQRLEYRSLMEQLWFLNGNLERLMLEPEFSWLCDESKEKIAFYEEHISKAHWASDIDPLKERLLQSLVLYRQVQDRIIKLGFTKAACEKPEALNEQPFANYLAAIQYVWEAFAAGKPKQLKSVNWTLKYNFSLQIVGLIKEYVQHLERMHEVFADKSREPIGTLLDNIDIWLYTYPLEEKAGNIKPLRFLEIYLGNMDSVAACDAKALTRFTQELTTAEAKPLSDRDKLRYALRLLACVQDKTQRVSLLKHTQVASLLNKFYNNTEAFREFYQTFQDCPLADMDFLNQPLYLNREPDNFYSILKVLGRHAPTETSPTTVGTLPDLPTVLKKLLDAGLSHQQMRCFAIAYITTAPLPASIVAAADVVEMKTYFNFPPVRDLINKDTDLPHQQSAGGLTQYLILKSALKEGDCPAELKDMQEQYDCAQLISNPAEREFFLLSLVCQYTKQDQDAICSQFRVLYSAKAPLTVPLLIEHLAGLKQLCGLVAVSEQPTLLNLSPSQEILKQVLTTLETSSGEEFATHWLPFLQANSPLQRKLLTEESYKKNPWLGFYVRIKDFKEQPEGKARLFSALSPQRVAELAKLPDPVLREVVTICLAPSSQTSILSPSLAKDGATLAIVKDLCDLLSLPQPQEASPKVVKIKSPASVPKVDVADSKRVASTEALLPPHPIHSSSELGDKGFSSGGGKHKEVKTADSDPPPSSSGSDVPASLPLAVTSLVPEVGSDHPRPDSEEESPAVPHRAPTEKAKVIERHAWLQIFLALLCASTAAAFLYVIAPLLPLLIATALSTVHILPIIMGATAFILGCLALYLGFEGIRSLIQPLRPAQTTVHDLPYTSFWLGYGLGIISLLLGIAVCVLSVYSIILFPAMTLLLTILATATPVCLGLYILARIHNVFDPAVSAQAASLDEVLVPKQSFSSSSVFQVSTPSRGSVSRPKSLVNRAALPLVNSFH